MDDTGPQPIVMFAGGGTGGHIYPNLAISERLIDRGFTGQIEFVVSNREIDQKALAGTNSNFTTRTLGIRPFSQRPWHWPKFLAAWNASKRDLHRWETERGRVAAVVTTGGFVSGPPIAVAAQQQVPTAMINLDAVPGIANRKMAKRAAAVFSVYDHPALPQARQIGLPLRRSAIGPTSQADARQSFGLNADRPTLFITGGSQGAQSVNDAVETWIKREDTRKALRDWQILHVCGPNKAANLKATYEQAGISNCVTEFCDTMGHAWRSASVAISRSGAGSVAEAWANATPTIFLPYPHHKDDHQRLNAGPICASGGALLLKDMIDANINADQLDASLLPIVLDGAQLSDMATKLAASQPSDGADAVAAWVLQQVKAT